MTIALLSIGGALVAQARDQQLVGGGDLVVLPAGIDLETLKTGGVSSMFFTIDQAPFLYREVLTSARFDADIMTAAPWIEDELIYLEYDGDLVPISAGGMIPSAAKALRVAPELVEGEWMDLESDRSWTRPTDPQLYASLDGMHVPRAEAVGDSTWAEWHYFNVLLPEDSGWLYLTYMVAGDVPHGRWGGRLLATLAGPGRGERSFTLQVEPDDVAFAEGEPDLRIGASSVSLGSDGAYRLSAWIPEDGGGDPLQLELSVAAASRRYLPPLEIGGGAFSSGYAVPLLDGRATGRLCVGSACTELSGARTYHDHNWGVWSQVTWDWGQAQLGDYSILYGGVAKTERGQGSRFLYVADGDGFGGVYAIRHLAVEWSIDSDPTPRLISVVAGRGRDSLRLEVEVRHRRVTGLPVEGLEGAALFYQLRGRAELSGRLGGSPVREAGEGFFETWAVRPGPEPSGRSNTAGAQTRRR